MKILREGGLRKFLDTRKGGSEKIVGLGGEAPKICILQNYQERGRGAPKKTKPLARGTAKISISLSPLVILNEHSLNCKGINQSINQSIMEN